MGNFSPLTSWLSNIICCTKAANNIRQATSAAVAGLA